MAYDAAREKSIEILKTVVTKAFAAGHPVTFGESEYVQLKRGQEIEVKDYDAEGVVEATESGIFKKCPKQRYNKELGVDQHGFTYLRFHDYGDVDELVDKHTPKMTTQDIDMMMAGTSAKSVLTAMAHERRAARPRQYMRQEDTGPSM
jgi:hypothetical protein